MMEAGGNGPADQIPGHAASSKATDMQRLIKDLGYEPHQRNNWYQLVN